MEFCFRWYIFRNWSPFDVLVFEKETDELFYLCKLKVTAAHSIKGFVELAEIPESKKILIKGAFNNRR